MLASAPWRPPARHGATAGHHSPVRLAARPKAGAQDLTTGRADG